MAVGKFTLGGSDGSPDDGDGLMPWARMNDHANSDPKLLALSDAAFRLWVCGVIYCQAQLTDGFIPRDAVLTFGVKVSNQKREIIIKHELCAALVRCKGPLWHEVDGGWEIHDYADWNDSRQSVLAERERTRQRQQQFRGRRHGVTNAVSNAVTNAERSPLVTVPTPHHSTPEDPDQEISSAPPNGAEPTSPVLMRFMTVGKPSQWALRQDQIDSWAQLYPNLSVLAEARKAAAWLLANPSRRKTAKGMPAFFVNWFNRAVNSTSGHTQAPQGRRTAAQTTIDTMRGAEAKHHG